MGAHDKKDACSDCGGSGSFTYAVDGKSETKTCGKCNGSGTA